MNKTQLIQVQSFSMVFNLSEMTDNLRALYDDRFNGVVFSTDLSQKSFNLENAPKHLGFTKNRLFMYSPVFLFPKKSVFINVFNEQMQILRETGMIEFWTKKFIDDRKSKLRHREPSKLQLDHILAAFQICGVLYLFSFILFILEIMSTKCRRIKSILDFFTY